jgi:hypothetical protein
VSTTLEAKRALLVAALKKFPPQMQHRLEELKREGETLRKRPDLLWYLLLQSAATQGNSRGWDGLCGDPANLRSVDYAVLAPLNPEDREARLLSALRKAKVRMPTVKAPRLSRNVTRLAEMGGVEQATKRMLGLPNRDEKLRFMQSFAGIGEKYGRNVWMDIYDPAFRDTVAVDERLKKIVRALGFTGHGYKAYEEFYCGVAREAALEPWELDRLLYNFTGHFLAAVGLDSVEPRTGNCS